MANDEPDTSSKHLLGLTGAIIAAYVAKNSIPATEIPNVIRTVHGMLHGLAHNGPGDGSSALKPAVPIKKSVTAEHVVCLEDGKKLKMLKRYLRTRYGLTPDAYRQRWGLPIDYPMVAPNYAAKRSEFAKKIGLGRKGSFIKKGQEKAARPRISRTR